MWKECVGKQADDVLRCAQLWTDEESAREYVAQVRWRLRFDSSALPSPRQAHYWQPDLIRFQGDDVFVDAGAFDGDTISEFLDFTESRFGRIYAFEPDGRNFVLLMQRLSRLPETVQSRIYARQQAIGDVDGPIWFNAGSAAAPQIGGQQQVECITLDTALPERPSYIKYDIEGFEPQALTGSRRIISEFRPALAVCVYHTQDHLWRLPLQIHSINPDYRFHLRAHGTIWETVCYAVPG
jgi:FkbM family methyltransferase